MNKELFEQELCESVELVSMLEHICAVSNDQTLPVAGMQLSLIQLRKKLLNLMSDSKQNTETEEINARPVFSSSQHGLRLSDRIKKIPNSKQTQARVRELLLPSSDYDKEVINS